MYAPITPLCMQAYLPALVFEASMPLFEKTPGIGLQWKIKLKSRKVAQSCLKSPIAALGCGDLGSQSRPTLPIGQIYVEPNITVEGNRLGAVDSFVSPGSTCTLSRIGSLDAEVPRRIAKASTAFGKLEKKCMVRLRYYTENTYETKCV